MSRSPAEMGKAVADPSDDDSTESEASDDDSSTSGQPDPADMSKATNTTAESASGVPSIGNYVSEIEKLQACRRGADDYLIVSARNGDLTMHEVDIGSLDCTCADKAYNRDDNEPCAHLAKAVLVEGNRPESTVEVEQLRREVRETEQTINDLTNALRVQQRSTEAATVADRNDSSRDESPEPDDDRDPVEIGEDWLRSHDLPVENMTVEVVSGDLRISSNNLSDKDFSYWTDSSWKPDGLSYDSDGYFNYVPVSKSGEVLDS